MIKVFPKFVDKELLTKWLPSVDRSLERPWPYKNMFTIIPHIRYPREIYNKICEQGSVSNTDLLVYRKDNYSAPHIDNYSITTGQSKWTATGILFISEPTQYEGGELCFNRLNLSMKPETGTFVMFPAGKDSHDYQHSVNKVVDGVREVLVVRFVDEIIHGV